MGYLFLLLGLAACRADAPAESGLLTGAEMSQTTIPEVTSTAQTIPYHPDEWQMLYTGDHVNSVAVDSFGQVWVLTSQGSKIQYLKDSD